MFRFDLFINLNAKSRKINVINLVAGGGESSSGVRQLEFQTRLVCQLPKHLSHCTCATIRILSGKEQEKK